MKHSRTKSRRYDGDYNDLQPFRKVTNNLTGDEYIVTGVEPTPLTAYKERDFINFAAEMQFLSSGTLFDRSHFRADVLNKINALSNAINDPNNFTKLKNYNKAFGMLNTNLHDMFGIGHTEISVKKVCEDLAELFEKKFPPMSRTPNAFDTFRDQTIKTTLNAVKKEKLTHAEFKKILEEMFKICRGYFNEAVISDGKRRKSRKSKKSRKSRKSHDGKTRKSLRHSDGKRKRRKSKKSKKSRKSRKSHDGKTRKSLRHSDGKRKRRKSRKSKKSRKSRKSRKMAKKILDILKKM